MFRCLHCTERQFRESRFQDCVWLGDICGIAFSIPQIFAIPKMKFSTAFSASRGWDDWVAANCFARFRKDFTEIPAYPFSIYIYLISLGSLHTSFTLFTSFSSVIAQLLSSIGVVVLHHDFQVNNLISQQSWLRTHQFHVTHFFLLCNCSVALSDCHRCSASQFPGKHSPLPISEIIILIWAFAC